MPDTRQLVALFEAVSHRNWEAIKTTALEIVQNEEQHGHAQAARKLRGALNGIGSNGHVNGAATTLNNDFSLNKALSRAPGGLPLSELQLRQSMRLSLEEIIAEWNATKTLQEAGIPRRSRLLFHGPPGCGKTATALALASALGVPAYVVRFDSLIGSYLGQTAARMREVFQFAAQSKCVLLLDEIDVLGKRRGSERDVGELDRIVVGLMQELDLSPIKGLIIGASNLPGQLDDALWRRFDLRMEFKAPNQREVSAYVRRIAARYSVSISANLKKGLAAIKDYATAERLIQDEARRQLLKQLVTS
jgi:ATP-dependent 26S proteasome regulatory subunit